MAHRRPYRTSRRTSGGGCCIVAAIFVVPFLSQYADTILPPIRMLRDKYLKPYFLGRMVVNLYYWFGGMVLRT